MDRSSDMSSNHGASSGQPPVKKLKFVEQLLRDKEVIEAENQSLLAEELLAYSEDKSRADQDVDPLEFWGEKRRLLKSYLPLFACHYLTAPASSSFVESIFSYAGFSSSKLRNKISDKNLEREVFLKINGEYL